MKGNETGRTIKGIHLWVAPKLMCLRGAGWRQVGYQDNVGEGREGRRVERSRGLRAPTF